MKTFGRITASTWPRYVGALQALRQVSRLSPMKWIITHFWIGEINRLRKTDKYDAYPPQVKQLFMQTREAHIQMIMTLGNMIPPNDESPPPPQPQPGQPPAGQQPQAAPHQQSHVAHNSQLPNNVNTQAAKPQGA